MRQKEKILPWEGGEALAQVAQRGGRCPIPGNIPSQAGWGSEQPDPAEDVPAHCRDCTGWALKGPSHPNHAVIPPAAGISVAAGWAGNAPS